MPDKISCRLPVSICAGTNLDALELLPARGHEDPVAVMQVKHGIGRNHGMCLLGAAGKGRRGKHAQLEEAGIGNLDAHLGGADGGIEHRADVADAAGERTIGIGVDVDLRFLAQLQLGNVVLVDIADDPNAWTDRRW